MKTVVSIKPEILQWVSQIIDMNGNLSIKKQLQQWKDGTKQPTFNQIEKLSKTTGIPIGYFFLNSPPKVDTSLLHYRTVDSLQLDNPSQNLLQTIRDMENIQEWMKNYLIASDFDPLDFVGSAKNEHDICFIANKIRKKLGLEEDWFLKSHSARDSFNLIRSKAENIGIIVMMNGVVGNNTHRVLEINEFRAFTLVDKIAPLIFINSNDSDNGKLFSLLHEITHIWLGVNSLYNDKYNNFYANKLETICNAVAAEILVPQKVFLTYFPKKILKESLNDIVSSIADYFKCGTTVVARKALENGRITNEEYNAIAKEAIRNFIEMKQAKKKKGGNYYKTLNSRLDRRFLNAIVNSTKEGKTLYTDAFRLTYTNRKTFMRLIKETRGEQL
jgi:Zn-dependent peptidase ImmA (M78 family)